MNKIVFNQLTFEVTRRCNMGCAHCLRGDAENVDLCMIDIDGVLNQAEAIGRLIITGGEPTLNLPAIRHIANGIVQRGIPLMRVQIVTNGRHYAEEFVTVIKRFSEIVHLTQQYGYGRMEREPWRVQIGVSLDRYHEAQDICKKNYVKLKNALKGYAEVLRISHGNAPKNEGRAVALKDSIDCTLTRETYMLQQIEVLSADHKPMCKFFDSYHLERPEQKIVCCGIYLNAYGEVLPGLACDMDYKCSVRVCDSWEPIWERVLEYNQAHERQHCTYCDDLRTKINLLRPKEESDREYALATAREAQDEPSAEPLYIGDVRRCRKEMAKWFMPDSYSELEKAASAKDFFV